MGKTHPETFGHVMAFLTTVHFQNLSEEQKRNVVRMTVPILKNVDLSKYKRVRERMWDKYILVRDIIHRYMCIGMEPLLCRCYVIANVMGLIVKIVRYSVRAIRNTFVS